MTVHQNSLEAYAKILEDLPNRRREVLHCIIKSTELVIGDVVTMEWVSSMLNRPVSAISGRFTELKRDGLIYEIERKGTTRDGNSCAIFRAKELNGQTELF